MAELNILTSRCRRAERLRRLGRVCRTSAFVGAGALFLATIAVLLTRTLGWPWQTAWSIALPALATPAAFALLWIRFRQPIADAALAFEDLYGLKTLFTTALALAPAGADAGAGASPITQFVLQKAEAASPTIRPGDIVEWRLRLPSALMVAGGLALWATTALFPTFDLLGQRERTERLEAEKEVRRAEARDIEELARQLKSELPARSLLADEEDLAFEMDDLANSLRDPALGKSDAMLKVSDMKQKIEDEREELRGKSVV